MEWSGECDGCLEMGEHEGKCRIIEALMAISDWTFCIWRVDSSQLECIAFVTCSIVSFLMYSLFGKFRSDLANYQNCLDNKPLRLDCLRYLVEISCSYITLSKFRPQ